jgi:phosphomannomutase/phosphoglucomutase
MGRIFGMVSLFAVIIIILSSIGVFWLSMSNLEDNQRKLTTALVKTFVNNFSSEVELLQTVVEQIATNPEVINAIESNDVIILKNTAKKFKSILPYALNLRISLPGIDTIDESTKPHLGYADLALIQKTFEAKQLPVVQGQGENRHFAITAAVKKNNQVIGVILASLQVDFIQSLLAKKITTNNFIILKQAEVVLAKAGNELIKTRQAPSLKIPKTCWQLDYWFTAVPVVNMAELIAIIIGASLFCCIASFFCYFRLNLALRKDQNMILEAVKDLMNNKEIGDYCLKLTEMDVVISALVKFKQILNNKEHITNQKKEKIITENANRTELNKQAEAKSKPKQYQAVPKKILPKNNPKEISTISKPVVVVLEKEKEKIEETIFNTYDIHGIVGKGLSKTKVYEIGLAVGTEVKRNHRQVVVVARDGRLSSNDLADGLIKGLTSTGCNVLNLGTVPTPLLYFITHHVGGRSGVMITAGHHPPEYNGLKIVINGEILANEKIQKIQRQIEDEDYITEALGSVETNNAYAEEYVGTICDDIQLKRNLKVVVDCGNGVASDIAPNLLKKLGCQVISLHCNIDGNFPNHYPDPCKPENFKDLIKAVQKNKADLGLAFDCDGNRLGVVDNHKNIIWPDRQMMLFSKQILANKPGAEIIYDVKCSHHLGEYIKKQGGRPFMWKAGHSFLKEKMLEKGAILAGGMSGNIAFNDRWFGFDDALYSAARLLEILAADERPCYEVFAELPNGINTPEILIKMAVGEKFKFMETFAKRVKFPNAKIIDIDGLRIEFEDGWALIRASNSSPSIMLRFEADSKKGLLKIQKRIKHLMGEINDGIKFPF